MRFIKWIKSLFNRSPKEAAGNYKYVVTNIGGSSALNCPTHLYSLRKVPVKKAAPCVMVVFEPKTTEEQMRIYTLDEMKRELPADVCIALSKILTTAQTQREVKMLEARTAWNM